MSTSVVTGLTEVSVPLRTGPPTREELLVYYPAKFTWSQLKIFVGSGDLGLLRRDKKLQQRYDKWAVGIGEQYGSIVNYLKNYRLSWGRPDTLSLLKSSLDVESLFRAKELTDAELPERQSVLECFCCETPPEYISIIQNDWPYSIPADIEHSLIWTKVPIYHPDLVADSIKARIDQDGLWGFTGNDVPPPSPSDLSSSIGALSEWGITLENMVKSKPPTAEEEVLIKKAGKEVHRFVQTRWPESDWETAWFVNPSRLQSVPGLAHAHVFARRK